MTRDDAAINPSFMITNLDEMADALLTLAKDESRSPEIRMIASALVFTQEAAIELLKIRVRDSHD